MTRRLPMPPVSRPVLLGLLMSLPACVACFAPDYLILPEVDDAALSDSLRALYRDDAALLALQQIPDPERRPVELPADLVEQLYRALVAVHSATDLPARDSVVAVYRIHTFGSSTLREIILGWDSAATWPEVWHRGERLTGYQPVDDLVLQYDLWPRRNQWCTPDGCTYFPSSWIVLRAEQALNTAALAAKFTRIPEVRYAEPNGVGGDGNRITAEERDAAWRLTYSVGYGDCPAGCIARRFWAFDVHPDASVTYVGGWGDPPPGAP